MRSTHSQFSFTQDDQRVLGTLVRSSKTAQAPALRARIVLLCGAGKTAAEVAGALGVTTATVYKWRNRFRESGLEGLKDRPRPGQPKKITEETVKRVLTMTVEQVPKEATHWSVRLMAKAAGITMWQVRQIWKAADLKPHRLKTFKISLDPDVAEKVVDVVGLYMNPPENALVLSVDEKTQIQALDRTQPMLPLRPGQIARRTHDYKRHGTTSLYAALDILTGQVIGRTTQRHRAKEFLDFLRQIDRSTPGDLTLHLILDNSSTHQTERVTEWLARHPRFVLHVTPSSASWLNAVEGWFSQLERRAIHRGVFTSVAALRKVIHRFIKEHNAESAKPFKWTKSASVILESVQRAKASR